MCGCARIHKLVVCVRERERERVCVCVCARARVYEHVCIHTRATNDTIFLRQAMKKVSDRNKETRLLKHCREHDVNVLLMQTCVMHHAQHPFELEDSCLKM